MRVWIASLIFYTNVYIVCELLRFAIKHQLIKLPKKYVVLVNEFIGTVQVCAPMFDVNLVLENYGLQGVFVEITFIELVNVLMLRDALADPCPLIVAFMKKRVSIQHLLAIVGIQFFGAYCSYLLVLGLWRLGIHEQHLHMLHKDCESDLTVTMLYGSLVEASGCLAAKLAEHFMEPRVTEQIMRFFGALLNGIITVLGISLTGMYANPIVAWSCTFNCGEVPHLAHFVVYWIAPIVVWHATDRLLAEQTVETPAEKIEKIE